MQEYKGNALNQEYVYHPCGFFWEVGAPRKLVKAKADGRDTGYSVEGLINLMHRTQNQEKQLELKHMIDSAMTFWFAKCSLLLHG